LDIFVQKNIFVEEKYVEMEIIILRRENVGVDVIT